MEAIVDFLYKDDCGAVTKSEDREYVADVGLHRGGLPLVSRDGEAGTGTYQQGKGPRANSKSGPTEYSTSVQCTGTGRSTSHNRNVMYNTLHSQHLKHEGWERYREVTEFDSLHDGICQVGDRRFPAHSYVRVSGSESLPKQLRFAEQQEKQEQGVVQERQDGLKVRGDPGKVSAV